MAKAEEPALAKENEANKLFLSMFEDRDTPQGGHGEVVPHMPPEAFSSKKRSSFTCPLVIDYP